MRDHPKQRPSWWETTLIMRDHPDNERPPWWEITLMRDHPEERPPWWETNLMKDQPDERIIIIVDISKAHYLQLKARAQCTYRKMQNISNRYEEKENKQSTPGYLNYHAMDNPIIYKEQTEHTRLSQLPRHGQSYNIQRTNRAHQAISTTMPWTIL